MSIEVMAVLWSAIGGLISFFCGYSVGRWAKSRAFRSSVFEGDVHRIVVNPRSDNPRTFVPESENAKLREQYEAVLADYRSEVAKLRKLVADMHTLATDHGVYVRYPYCDAWEEKLAIVEKQMRELGVDV